jgi:hypothetical protein
VHFILLKSYCAFYFIKKRMKRKRGAGKEDNLYSRKKQHATGRQERVKISTQTS